MASIVQYWRALKKLQEHSLVELKFDRTNDSIVIGGIQFRRLNRLNLMKLELFPRMGILVSDLSPEEEKFCKSNGVSFLTSKGKLFLTADGFNLNVETLKRKKESKKKKVILNKRGPSATALVSPNGLDILDVLFRLPSESLGEFKSALSFVHEFHLSQPKLSQMMKELHAKTVSELKEKIKSLPSTWWETSLRYSLTKKRLQPFFENEKLYKSIRTEISTNQLEENIHIWLESKKDIAPGPVELVKELGLIRDSDVYLWCTPASLQELKTSFKLIPDRKVQETSWHIATVQVGLERSTVLSPLAFKKQAMFLPEIKANLFRSIWDLGFGGERLKEVQLIALRRVLDAV